MSTLEDGAKASRSPLKHGSLKPEQLDDLGNALLVMARELWVVKDRQRVLEALLAEHGVLVPGEVADHQPGPALTEELDRERSRYLRSLMDALCPPQEDEA